MNEFIVWFKSLDLGEPAVIALRVTLIAVVAWIAVAVLHRMIRAFRQRIALRFDEREQVKRAETIGRVFRYLATVIVTLIASVSILSEFGVSIAPILGAAGVVGLAIGFGAQSLVKDYFTGFFLLLENQLTTGDVVEVGDRSGLVEDVTLRYVRLRDYDGNVHFVPNNLISTVKNMSRGFAQAVIDVGVAYRENIDEALAAMRAVGHDMRADAVFGPKTLDELEIAGVERWDDSAGHPALPFQGGAARAVGRPARISETSEERVRRTRHRDSVSTCHLVRRGRQGWFGAAVPCTADAARRNGWSAHLTACSAQKFAPTRARQVSSGATKKFDSHGLTASSRLKDRAIRTWPSPLGVRDPHTSRAVRARHGARPTAG